MLKMSLIITNTVKEFLRNKLVKLIFFCSILFIFLSIIISKFTISENNKIITDFWFFFIEIFGVIITLFFGANLIYDEQKRKTLNLILIKNNSWTKFITWKYIWFALILMMYLIVVSLIFFVINLYFGSLSVWLIWLIIFSIYIKLLVLLSIIMFFCSFISPIIAMITSLIIYFVAHFLAFVKYYISLHFNGVVDFTRYITDFTYYVLPNFQTIDFKEYLSNPVFMEKITSIYIINNIGVQIVYIFVIISLTVIIFNRKYKKV